jgi:hypothetical protein
MRARRAIMSACSLTSVAALAGCFGSPAGRSLVVKAVEGPSGAGLLTKVATAAILIRWQEPGPDGRVIPVLETEAKDGTVDASSQSGTFRSATGWLYKDGRRRARFKAPVVEARREQSRVTARGGVVVWSVDPPGVTVFADRATWFADRGRIVAEGGVRFRQKSADGRSTQAIGGPFDQVTISTELEKITIP